MSNQEYKVYGYRWVVLLLFMFVNIIIQILWISFATVTSTATTFFGVDEIAIYLLSITFMLIYIPITFVSAWVIDKYNFKIGTILGALFTGVFGFIRIFTGGNYIVILICQIGVAIAQPFFLNSVTKLSSNWFPPSERTTATGIGVISILIGTALGLFITPLLVETFNFQTMLLTYGILSLVACVIYLIFVKNKPPTPPSEVITDEKVMMLDGLKKLIKNFNFIILIVAFLIGLGIFNTILTYIEGIVLPRGYDTIFAGIFGGLILLGGIVGSFVMSILSDKYKKRKILLVISITIALCSLLAISFITNYILLDILGFIFGFGLVSSSPVGLEYAVDITKPVPEATSNGILMMSGQIGGIIMILGLENFTMPITGDYFPALILQTILLAVVLVFVFFIKERKK